MTLATTSFNNLPTLISNYKVCTSTIPQARNIFATSNSVEDFVGQSNKWCTVFHSVIGLYTLRNAYAIGVHIGHSMCPQSNPHTRIANRFVSRFILSGNARLLPVSQFTNKIKLN